MGQGTYGRVQFGSDFTGLPLSVAAGAVPLALDENIGGGLGLIGVNEGTIDITTDEPGGILAITTDTGDDDNHFLLAGVFKPADGGMWLEARLKINSVAATRAAMFVGFTETLSRATPVMPAETATVTTTYNGTGGMIGFVFDSDATTIAWRFVAGDGGAALATKDENGTVGGAIGINADATITADRWYVIRVEVDTNGKGRGLLSNLGANDVLKLVGENTAALGTGDNFFAAVGVEARVVTTATIMEVDYFKGEGFRDWASD